MKKFIFSCFMFSLLLVSAQAQQSSCCKAGSKSSASCQVKAPSSASASTTTEYSLAAAQLASTDQTIETRTDPITGSVTYVRKGEVDQYGNASFVSVNYDASTNTFVNVSPSTTGATHDCGSMKATSVSGKSGCTPGASSGKSCCAGKVATTTKTTEKIKS